MASSPCPADLGTIEEFFEVLTWAQLGMHHKPCGFLNTAGYFDKLLEFLDHAAAERSSSRSTGPWSWSKRSRASLLDKFDAYVPPDADMARWALDLRTNDAFSIPIKQSGNSYFIRASSASAAI